MGSFPVRATLSLLMPTFSFYCISEIEAIGVSKQRLLSVLGRGLPEVRILSLAEVRPRKGQDQPRAEKDRHHLDETPHPHPRHSASFRRPGRGSLLPSLNTPIPLKLLPWELARQSLVPSQRDGDNGASESHEKSDSFSAQFFKLGLGDRSRHHPGWLLAAPTPPLLLEAQVPLPVTGHERPSSNH